MRSFALLFAIALLAASPPCPAQDAAELEVDHQVHSEFVTPHTAWAKPYAQGKTRVLFFLRGHGTEPREVIELQQRFDFEVQMVFWARVIDSTQEQWHGAERGIQRMSRLLAEKWDAFVFLSPSASGVRDVIPDMLPADQQYLLLKAVTEGAGLVIAGSDDKRVLKDKNRLPELPGVLGDVDRAAAFSVLKGRGVRLPKAPPMEYRLGWEVVYDEWDMRLGKAILWAAGKEPKLSLTVSSKPKEVARASLPGPVASLTWQGAIPGTQATIQVRRDDGQVLSTVRQTLNQQGGVNLTLPQVRCGTYFLDVVARDGHRVAGFASTPVTVTDASTLSLKLDPAWSEIGGTLAGTVHIGGGIKPGQSVVISLRDRHGRQIARQTLSGKASVLPFQFGVEPWFPMSVEVRAGLEDATGEIDTAWQFANIVKRHRGQFNFVMWDLPRGTLAPWAEQALANTGVTIHLANGSPPAYLAAQDMAWIPYTTHIDGTKDANGVMKPACWQDAAKIQTHVDSVVAKHEASRRHGVFAYSLGDEVAVRGSCLSPHCLAGYRVYLSKQYGNIAALNTSWGSSYASFQDVQLSKPDDNDEAESLKAENFPRWFDRQAYQSSNFAMLCERFGKAFRNVDPESRCGFEGAGTFGHADDLDAFVRSNTFWSPYPGTADEVVRSIAPRDFPHANWMGYTKDADSLLEKYWRMITRGCDSVWWWRWDALGRFHGWLAPNLDPYPAVADILRDTRIVRDGLGDLLLTSEMQTDGIGVIFSQPSAYAARAQASPSFGTYEGSHTALHGYLRELGLNFRYFTDRQLRLGEVDLRQFKAVFLPLTQALGAQEAELLRAYVRNGGLLIADVRPGIYDGHVKPLPAGQLDEVFGVKRTGFAAAKITPGSIPVTMPGGRPETLSIPAAKADPGIQAAGATAAGSAGGFPLWLSHSFGNGQALLMNLSMASLPALNAPDTAETAAQLLRDKLSQAQIAAPLALTVRQGQRLKNVEITRWMNGPVQIVSLFRHQGSPEPATLHLPGALQIYDLKAGKHLGKRDALDLDITPARAQFFALAPQPLSPITLQTSPAVAKGEVQKVTIHSALSEGRQALRIEVRLPDGSTADWVDRVAIVDQQGSVVDVPVAHNDPAGTWSFRATELYTGAVASTEFVVKGAGK